MVAGSRREMLASRVLVRGGIWALGAGLGMLLGCPFELQRGLSCGDGWWDPEFEECDPRDPDASHVEACREQGGFVKDATCDPQTCTVRASEVDCNQCGDGRAAADEQCDGLDLRGETCAGVLSCDDNCQLDYSACGQVCGDGVVLGDEECESEVEGGFKSLACSDYESTASGIDKHYTSGTVGSCNKENCTFGRNDCSFCGDGELDPGYIDYVAPEGTYEWDPEVCDGDEILSLDILEDHCEALCTDDPINGDVVVYCDFECADDCSGIAPPDDLLPEPEAIKCCVAKGSPCPKFDIEGVPNLPCCSWLENPDWFEEEKCVVEETNTIPITFICP